MSISCCFRELYDVTALYDVILHVPFHCLCINPCVDEGLDIFNRDPNLINYNVKQRFKNVKEIPPHIFLVVSCIGHVCRKWRFH